MLHDRRQDRRFQLAPVQIVIGAGDGQEIGAEKHPLHAFDGEQRLRQGRDRRVLGAKLPRALAHHLATGQELQHIGVGRGLGLNEHSR